MYGVVDESVLADVAIHIGPARPPVHLIHDESLHAEDRARASIGQGEFIPHRTLFATRFAQFIRVAHVDVKHDVCAQCIDAVIGLTQTERRKVIIGRTGIDRGSARASIRDATLGEVEIEFLRVLRRPGPCEPAHLADTATCAEFEAIEFRASVLESLRIPVVRERAHRAARPFHQAHTDVPARGLETVLLGDGSRQRTRRIQQERRRKRVSGMFGTSDVHLLRSIRSASNDCCSQIVHDEECPKSGIPSQRPASRSRKRTIQANYRPRANITRFRPNAQIQPYRS